MEDQTKDVLLGETFRAGVRTPAFNPNDPELWFPQLEGQFVLSNISADATKFYYVLAQLESQHAAEVRDLVVSPPTSAKYETQETELIRRLSASKERKIKQLLMHEEMRDRKRTQFLQHLAGVNVPADFIRIIWASRLPTHLQTCIAAQQAKMALEDLAELADRVNDVVPVTSQVASTLKPVAHRSNTDNTIEALTQAVSVLSRRMETMSMDLHRRARSCSRTRGSRSTFPISSTRPSILLVPPSLWQTSAKMYSALQLQESGKLPRQPIVAATDCLSLTSRLFITDCKMKIQYLVDTGSDLCVFPRSAVAVARETYIFTIA